MTRLKVRNDTPQAQAFLEYASKLPFVEIDGEKPKRTFEEAVAEIGGGYSVDEFCDALDARLKTHFQNA